MTPVGLMALFLAGVAVLGTMHIDTMLPIQAETETESLNKVAEDYSSIKDRQEESGVSVTGVKGWDSSTAEGLSAVSVQKMALTPNDVVPSGTHNAGTPTAAIFTAAGLVDQINQGPTAQATLESLGRTGDGAASSVIGELDPQKVTSEAEINLATSVPTTLQLTDQDKKWSVPDTPPAESFETSENTYGVIVAQTAQTLIALATPASDATSFQNTDLEQAFITTVGWNVELNDAAPQVIALQLAAFQDVDLWGIAEVNHSWVQHLFEEASEVGEGSDFASVLSVSGGGDRLLAIYDANRFELERVWEINEINTTGNARAPLVLQLRERNTELVFLFMVNHLYRSRNEERHIQAQLLNEWAARQDLPIVAVGDYNFDWDIEDGVNRHDHL